MKHAEAQPSLRSPSTISLVETELGDPRGGRWEVGTVGSLDFFQFEIAGLDLFQFQIDRFHRGVARDQLPRAEKSSNGSSDAISNNDDGCAFSRPVSAIIGAD
jgi:hypothetical protein